MKLVVTLDVTQVVGETWVVEVCDEINIVDYIEALKEDPSLLFRVNGYPDQIDMVMIESEVYDDLSTEVVGISIKKECCYGK
jgi:hypothetical protein